MFLQRIIISNFKNITDADLQFSPKINCICGDNGEGKTNLLDAIYYLSMTKSFLLSSDQYTFKIGTNETMLHGVYDRCGVDDKISVCVREDGDKVVRRNSKNYPKISDHIGLFPIVIISPSDASLINDSGEERRRFMNIILSQTDKEYLTAIQLYNKTLLQRNKLLKSDTISDVLLDTLSEQLSKWAVVIHRKRGEMIDRLNGLTSGFYSSLSGEKEFVSMEYISDMNDTPIEELLQNSRNRDKFLKYTTVGIQRDDLSFLINGKPMKKCSSQGQQKTFLISLKMAQYTLMGELYKCSPILLLDDVFDKLDMKRVEYLINTVANQGFGQIFITDCNKDRITSIVKSITEDRKFFSVVNGIFSQDVDK